jgi:hypothetical protein
MEKQKTGAKKQTNIKNVALTSYTDQHKQRQMAQTQTHTHKLCLLHA